MIEASAATVAADVGYGILYALVLLGALPSVVTFVQFLLVARHGRHDHYDRCDPAYIPRVAVLVPAWNEAAVLDFSVDRMLALDYPPDRLRMVIVDDASTDSTPELLEAKQAQYPSRVVHLRREKGGEGKAHTLNHGLTILLADDWAEAVMVTDADVVFEPDSIRRMVRHLADPDVGAVTAFIREASTPPNWMSRYIGYEYVAAQGAARRAQNVLGAMACLAGGAQMLSRANLDALGGRVDTSTLAEDTVTTIKTQLAGRRVIYDGNAQCLAEEPADVTGLWKQRLRWARGNVQVSKAYRHVFFHRSRQHGLGGFWFGMMWFSTLLLPILMIVASAALAVLWPLRQFGLAQAFIQLWIVNALIWIFTTAATLLLDGRAARLSWRQAFMFPGLISVLIMAGAIAPSALQHAANWLFGTVGLGWDGWTRSVVLLLGYLWVGGCMLAAWGVYRLDRTKKAQWLVAPLLALVGYGPMLCAITFAAYVAEVRGAAITWDKTEKTGKVSGAV